MRPFVSPREGFVIHVLSVGDRIAVVTPDHLDWLDARLLQVGRTTLPEGGRRVSALDDGRLLLHSEGFGTLHVGREHGDWERVRVGGEDYVSGLLPTPSGFLAWTQKHLLIDVRGERRELALDLVLLGGATTWGSRVVLATSDALLVISGDEMQRHALRCKGAPVAAGPWLLVPTDDDAVVVFDEALQEKERVDGERVFPWGTRAVTLFKNEVLTVDPNEEGVLSFEVPSPMTPLFCGDFYVVGSWDSSSVAFSHRAHEQVERLELPGRLQHAAKLGDGVVCSDAVSSEATWWRPGGARESLSHDFTPHLLCEVPGGVVTADANVLYLWRPGEDGPALPVPSEGPPLDAPLVISGQRVVVKQRGHFASRGVTGSGAAVRIGNDARWRRACDAETAKSLLDRLLARDVEGEVPALPGQPLAHTAFQLLQPSPQASYALQARALFARDRLSDGEQFAADITRSTWLEELGAALGVSGRTLFGAVQARRFPLKPPKELAGYEYLGTFETEGTLTVSDPCHLGKKTPAVFPISQRLEVRAGTWHAWVRQGTGEFADRTAELLVSHVDGLGVAANVLLGSVGVDAGFVGVFDARCPKPEGHYDEGVFRGKAAMASSGIGDGSYPAFSGTTHGQVTKVRVWFLGPGAPELDASLAKAGSRKYSPKERFEVGETLEHPTFGVGTVARERDGKLEVHFGETVKLLVHRRG